MLLFSLHFEIKKLLQKLESHDHIHRGYDGDDVCNSILSMSTESTQILSEQVHIIFIFIVCDRPTRHLPAES